MLFPKIRSKARCLFLLFLWNIILEVLATAMRQEKKIVTQIENAKIRFIVFANDMKYLDVNLTKDL